MASAEYHREWYAKNKERIRARKLERANKRRHEIRDWVRSLKKRCERCGFDNPIALDYHHVGSDKDFNVADAVKSGWGKDRIAEEIQKCILLCANCHRIEHHTSG